MSENKSYDKAIKARSDAFLRYVAEAAEEEIMRELEGIESQYEDVEIPTELDEKLRAMAAEFQREKEKKQASLRYKKYSKIAAVVMLAITLTLTMAISNADALRLRIFDFLFHENDKYTEIKPLEIANDAVQIKELLPQDWTNVYYPSWLPEGYEFVKAENIDATGDKKVILFKNNQEDTLVIEQNILNKTVSMGLDNEGDKSGELTIRGHAAYWRIKINEVTLFWSENQTQIVLSGKIEIDTLAKIAENLTFVK